MKEHNATINKNESYLIRVFFLAILFFALIGMAKSSEAANRYVRPNGTTYGSGNGSDWNNAYSGFSAIPWSSVSCGDTIWVAGGTYTTGLTPAKNCTSGSILTLTRARSDSTACTTATGWNSSYDSMIQQNSAGIYFSGGADYITFSGRTTAAGGTQGWTITYNSPAVRPINSPAGTGAISHVTFEYMNVNGGQGISTDSNGNDSRAFNLLSSGTSYITISHVNITGFCAGVYSYVNNFTFEYGSISDMNPADNGVSGCHVDPIFPISGNNGIVRYSVFHDNYGEGIYWPSFGGAHWDNWQIYGNVFYNLGYKEGWYGKALELENPITHLKVFNNTFYNNWSDFNLTGTWSCDSTDEIRNNISYWSSGLPSGCGVHSNNIQIGSGNAPNPFVNLGAYNFNIVSNTGGNYPRNAGMNESSYLTTDIAGNTFGADGTWDVGAYEYVSGITHTVTSLVSGGNGTLSCTSPVNDGATTTCSASPASGYYTSSISGCNGAWSSGNGYTTGAITADCAVTATFASNPVTQKPSAPTGLTVQ